MSVGGFCLGLSSPKGAHPKGCWAPQGWRASGVTVVDTRGWCGPSVRLTAVLVDLSRAALSGAVGFQGGLVEAQARARCFCRADVAILDLLGFLQVWVEGERVLLQVDWVVRGA